MILKRMDFVSIIKIKNRTLSEIKIYYCLKKWLKIWSFNDLKLGRIFEYFFKEMMNM